MTTRLDPSPSVHGLSTAELLALATARLWVAAHAGRAEAPLCWRSGLRAAGLRSDAAFAFDALFTTVAQGAVRPIAFHCPSCSRLGPDERIYLDLLALLQQGWADRAQGLLRPWLAPAAARLSLGFAEEVALALAGAGLRLPIQGVAVDPAMGLFSLSDQGLALIH